MTIEEMAAQLAKEQLEAVEFLTVSEASAENGWDLTEQELRAVYRLVYTAKPVIRESDGLGGAQ